MHNWLLLVDIHRTADLAAKREQELVPPASVQQFLGFGAAELCSFHFYEILLPPLLLLQEPGAAHNSSRDSSSDQLQQPLRITLLQAVRAPSRSWLQSFFADLKPDKRQVSRHLHLLACRTDCMLVILSDAQLVVCPYTATCNAIAASW
jgi:hypothetical protein